MRLNDRINPLFKIYNPKHEVGDDKSFYDEDISLEERFSRLPLPQQMFTALCAMGMAPLLVILVVAEIVRVVNRLNGNSEDLPLGLQRY